VKNKKSTGETLRKSSSKIDASAIQKLPPSERGEALADVGMPDGHLEGSAQDSARSERRAGSYREEMERKAEADRESYRNLQSQLLQSLTPLIEPLGFEIVELEVHTHRNKLLRLYIDRMDPAAGAVSLDDCAHVSRSLNEPLDTLPELEAVFKGTYELEVSSPGVDRPLRHSRDFLRFVGRRVRVHLSRPLTSEESGNAEFTKKHPRQISYLGKVESLENESVMISVTKDDGAGPARGSQAKPGSRPSTKPRGSKQGETAPRVAIPLALISKANLDPEFDFSASEEDEVIVL
jgi:ribosome maturation factor RimP